MGYQSGRGIERLCWQSQIVYLTILIDFFVCYINGRHFNFAVVLWLYIFQPCPQQALTLRAFCLYHSVHSIFV